MVLSGDASDDALRSFAAMYLLNAKRSDGKPLDPVARFHLGNGSEIHAVHSGADLSENGLRQSRGAMVNYLYETKFIEKNHEAYLNNDEIKTSGKVSNLVK